MSDNGRHFLTTEGERKEDTEFAEEIERKSNKRKKLGKRR